MIEEGQENYISVEDALFFARRSNVFLFKQFLCLLEDLRTEHVINFEKLNKNLPKEYKSLIEMSDYFGEKHFARIRKKVLDFSGDAFRNLESDLNNI